MRTLVLLLLVAVVSSKVFERCEWAWTMRFYGLNGYYNHTLADWLCLTSSVSNFNTSAITHRFDGAKFYGIFQVKGGMWCNDDDPKSALCGVSCTELLTDNVRVAIKCAQTILGDQGLKAWGTWTYECKNRDLSSYLDGCEIPCIPN